MKKVNERSSQANLKRKSEPTSAVAAAAATATAAIAAVAAAGRSPPEKKTHRIKKCRVESGGKPPKNQEGKGKGLPSREPVFSSFRHASLGRLTSSPIGIDNVVVVVVVVVVINIIVIVGLACR